MSKVQHNAELLITDRVHYEVTGRTILFGRIFNDTHTHGYHPFADGRSIRTSFVEKEYELDGVKYVQTNNTLYKVIDDAPAEIKQPDCEIGRVALP